MFGEKMWGAEPFWGLGAEWDPQWLLTDRQKQLQAVWLARAGVELAAARLLSNPADYKSESLALFPGPTRLPRERRTRPLLPRCQPELALGPVDLAGGARATAHPTSCGRCDSRRSRS